MTTNTDAIQNLLDRIPALQKTDRQILQELSDRLQPLRYRMGQVILRCETMPDSSPKFRKQHPQSP